jgi:hypothetical protein
MDDATVRGLTAVAIGIVLFLMGLHHGKRQGVTTAVEYMLKTGMLGINKEGHIIAGPKLKDK